MRCYILGAVIALHLFLLSVQANLENQGGEMAFQEPVTVKHAYRPGDREYLSPNLLGLQNIAVTFLPLTKTFVNIIDAFREIVNGVRYDILLNTVHMGMNGEEETVCRLVILEKPWLRTEWGDKVRLLQYSNCTSDTDEDLFGTGTTFDSDTPSDRFINNPVFDGGSLNKLSTNELKRLEGQILSAISSKRFNETKTTTSQDFAERATYVANTESDMESQGENAKSAELSESDKEWLNNFFSIGAFNFEKSLQDATASPTDSAQVEESPLTRSKRSYNDRITGAPTKLDHNDAEKRLKNSLKTLATGEGPTFKLLRIHKASTQLVAGSLIKIDCDLENAEDGKLEHCKVEIWSQPWLNEGAEITIKCPNKELVTSRLSRSVENAEKKIHKKRDHFNLNKVEHLFAKFQLKYKRQYHTVAEKQMRLRIFAKNLKLIAELNRKEMGSAKYGITEFADFTTEEYKLRTGLWSKDRKKAASNATAVIPNIDLPKEFDWRDKGAVTKVKNQGMCGSCWAFSAIGNIEGLQAIQSKYLVEFSEQELLDCDTEDKACMGGLPDNAFEAIKKIGGLELESDYPYHGHKGKCQFNLEAAHVYVKGYVDLPKNETAIAQWLVANGPISIGINANAMQFYRGGVSHPWHMLCSHKSLDHGVLIVGYGVSEYPMFKKTLPYWIIKNSWGSKWGEQGYYRVYRGDNSCGVSEMASSATIT